MPVLKLVTLAKLMTDEHSNKILQKYSISTVSTTVATHEPFATHNQWTSLSDLGDQFCLGILF